jgi:acyl-[acyl-carrier-protein]-phospholipid O-acyltransferase/long-chain-fatty-acid--[acyl-carrier-protein] ligase
MFSNRKMIAVTTTFARKIASLDSSQNIGLMLPASSAGIISNMAVLLKGKTTVNLNYTTSENAVQGGIKSAEIKTVLTSKQFVKKLTAKGIDVEAMLKNVKVIYLEELKAQLSKITYVSALLATFILPAKAYYSLFGKTVSVGDNAAILFSSGSEGTPKGIMLSHRNFIANIKQISDVLRTRDDEVVMGSLPPFHSFGLTVTTLLPLIEGVPVVCHPDPTDVLNISKAVSKYKATLLCATATFLRLYTRNKKVQPLMLSSLRTVVAGAERLPETVRAEFKAKFNKDIYEGYGATETTPVASVNIPDKLDPNDWRIQQGNKPGTVGMPLPGCAFRIVDPLTLESLPTGESGLILISGNQVMSGYLHDETKTKEVIVELDGRRWYKSGDKGYLDSDGFLSIVDRYSRFAKIGGEMVSLTSVEKAVSTAITALTLTTLALTSSDKSSSNINDLVEILAVNLPDTKKGERIVLLSTEEIDLKTLKDQLITQQVNALMFPAVIYHVDYLPKLGSGKNDFAGAKKLAAELATKLTTTTDI